MHPRQTEREAKRDALLAKVRKVDQDTDSPPEDSFTSGEYAVFTNLSHGQARAHLRRLEKEGKIKTVHVHDKGEKHYRLVDEAERDRRFTGPPGMVDSLRKLDAAADKALRG